MVRIFIQVKFFRTLVNNLLKRNFHITAYLLYLQFFSIAYFPLLLNPNSNLNINPCNCHSLSTRNFPCLKVYFFKLFLPETFLYYENLRSNLNLLECQNI